jgi:hypothetical protein
MAVSASAFLALPVEIILKILEGCEYQGILACMLVRVSTDILSLHTYPLTFSPGGRLANACMTSFLDLSAYRYLLELAANGMRDDPRSSLGKIQRLNLLAEHETAWRTLSWSDNTSIDMLGGWGEPVSVSGNIIALPQCAPMRPPKNSSYSVRHRNCATSR